METHAYPKIGLPPAASVDTGLVPGALQQAIKVEDAEAVAIVRRQIGKHQTHVFTRCGKVLKYWDAVQWKAACRRAGITNFRFHDVRHTWASWHVLAGTPLNRLMEMGGWATYEMVLRYAHLAPDHLAEHANAVQISAQPVTEFGGTANKKAG